MKQQNILRVVKPGKTPAKAVVKPPRPLGQSGQALWQRICSEYEMSDAAGRELLALGCEALDRAQSCREIISREGEVFTTRNGFQKEHPLLRAELASRSFCAKMLLRLGLDVEPIRDRHGRPPKVSTWTPPMDEE